MDYQVQSSDGYYSTNAESSAIFKRKNKARGTGGIAVRRSHDPGQDLLQIRFAPECVFRTRRRCLLATRLLLAAYARPTGLWYFLTRVWSSSSVNVRCNALWRKSCSHSSFSQSYSARPHKASTT